MSAQTNSSEPQLPLGELRGKVEDPQVQEAIRRADVIFGVDVKDERNRSLFFGKATLERIVKTGNAKLGAVVCVPVDFETEDVEVLAAACYAMKGSCCYQGTDDPGEMINPSFN